MALDNYANLTSQMKEWALDRPDLVPYFQDCIDMAINDINAVIRMREQQKTVELVPNEDGEFELPEDYAEWRRVTWTGNPRVVLEPLSPEGEIDIYPSPHGGPPQHFSMEDNIMTVLPLDAVTPIELMYWAKVPYLRPDPPELTTNWLLQKNSNIILFGAMKYVEVFKRNEKGMQTFGQLYSGEVDGMVRTSKRSQWSRMRARVAGRSTP